MRAHLSRPDIGDQEVALVNEVLRSPTLALDLEMAEFEEAT